VRLGARTSRAKVVDDNHHGRMVEQLWEAQFAAPAAESPEGGRVLIKGYFETYTSSRASGASIGWMPPRCAGPCVACPSSGATCARSRPLST